MASLCAGVPGLPRSLNGDLADTFNKSRTKNNPINFCSFSKVNLLLPERGIKRKLLNRSRIQISCGDWKISRLPCFSFLPPCAR